MLQAVEAAALTAKAHREAQEESEPYVIWVTNELRAQKQLRAWDKELMEQTSRAWEVQESSRAEANEAIDKVCRAAEAFAKLPGADGVDVSRHKLFKIVVEESYQRQQKHQRKQKQHRQQQQ